MTATSIDVVTGDLLVAGKRVFPIGLSDPPPLGSTAPWSGLPAWAEIAAAGVGFVRNYTVWRAAGLDEQLISVAEELDAAPEHGLQLWLALAGVDDDLGKQSLLDEIVNEFKGHPGLGVWKGVDEPAHGHVPAAGCVAVYRAPARIDPDHPVVIIEAPRGPSPSAGKPRHAADRRRGAAVRGRLRHPRHRHLSGLDPPGAHAGGPPVNTDISVVGDMTGIIAQATRRKAIWTTLADRLERRLPAASQSSSRRCQQARFMAYDAIVAGARGLFFFGGQFKQVMNDGRPAARLELDLLAQVFSVRCSRS